MTSVFSIKFVKKERKMAAAEGGPGEGHKESEVYLFSRVVFLPPLSGSTRSVQD